MKILYMGPLSDSSAINGGYSYIAKSFNHFFKELENNNEIETYTSINTNEKYSKIILEDFYDVGIILTHPNSFHNDFFKNSIENIRSICNRFYIHVFWECNSLPKEFNWMFQSSLFDGFIASSDFVKSITQDRINEFKTSQRVLKVYPVFYKDEYKDVDINVEFKKNENIFSILYMGQYTKRKGMEDAVTAFAHALGDKEDCQLILKYHRLSKLEFSEEEMIKRTVAMNCKDFKAKIFEITDNLNRQQIFDLYKSSSVLLHPSRGEGFGLCITETGIIGLPIIYADNSSCVEVSGQNRQWKIPCIVDTATGMSHYDYSSDSCYGVPRMSNMIDSLKQAYSMWKDDKEKYYEFKNKNFIFEKFSEKVVIEQIKKLI